jgi:hypothetical protein
MKLFSKSINKLTKYNKALLLMLLLISSISSYSQYQISVSFSDGFIGNDANGNSVTSAWYLSSLGWSSLKFTQNSTGNLFIAGAQGNDVPGNALITDYSGTTYSIPGALNWRTPSGNNPTIVVFVPAIGVNLNLVTKVSPFTYNIIPTKDIGLNFNGSALSITGATAGTGTVSGNAAGILNVINTYLGSIPSVITSTTPLTTFSACSGSVSAEQSFTVSGTGLGTNLLVVTAPSGYQVSTTSGGTFGSSVSFTPASGSVTSKTVYVRLASSATNGVSDNIIVSSTGAVSSNIATGSAVVTAAANAGTLSGTQTICSNETTTLSTNGNLGGAWTSSITGVATVDPASGVVSGVAAGTSTITYTITGTGGCSNASATRLVTVNPLPTITLDYIDDVPVTATSFSIPYTALAGSPDKYSLTTASNSGTSVAMAGFTPITNATITSSPILVTIPASAAAEYGFNLTVTNSSTGCSSVYPFQFHVTSINHGTIGSNQTICSGATPATLTTVTPGSATNGATITYTWENSSTNLLTGYTTISGATEENYSPEILTQTTYYKRVAHATIGGVDVTADSDPVTITVTPVAESGSISGTSTVCTTTNSAILNLEGSVGNVSKWQYSSDNFESDSHDVSNTTTTLTATNLLATTYYRALVASGSCSTATSTSFEIVVLSSNIWTGTTSTAWSTTSNWSCGIPLSGDSIEIPGGLTNYPVLDGSKTIGNVILADGATINLNNAILSVSGTFSGTGTLIGGNTSSLTINGSGPKGTFYMDQTSAETKLLDNFTLNTTTGSATLGNALDISGILTLTNGTLSTGGNLTLKSSSTKTAVVAEITDCNAVAITGDVTVEQYFPLKRAFRFISSPVTTTTTIRDNWQEGGNNAPPAYTNNWNPHPGYGTHITGTIIGSNGFDATQTTNNSMFTYNNTLGAWATIPNTNVLTLTAGVPYRLLIRGDRSTDMSSNTPPSTNTTLRAKGELKICNAPAVPLNQNADGLSFIGNPYQAVVDIKKALIRSTDFAINYYWVWDPKINTRGGYVTYDLQSGINPIMNSQVNKYLQPWQACFVKNKQSGGGSITFQESDKVTDTKRNIYKTNSESNPASYIRLTLYESNTLATNGSAADGLIVKFGANYDNAVDENDAAKFSNQDETFATKNSSTLLGIESRSFPTASETVPLNITNYRSTNYTLVASGTNISGLTAYLYDELMKTYTEIPSSDSAKYSFAINANDASTSASDRFKIVLQNKNLDLQTTTATAFTMYPNPSLQGVFDVVMNEVPKDTKLTIYNEMGQEVYTTNLTESSTNHINPNKAFAKGVYYVKIKNETATTVNKLIIE